MKKFENITLVGNEKSIKVGKNVPNGSIGLGLFSMKDISPSNNIIMTDLSQTIPENKIVLDGISDQAKIYMADELGFLHDKNGNYNFPTNDLTIGDSFISKKMEPSKYLIDELIPEDFAHHYYISRYFIPCPPAFSLLSLDQWINTDNLQGLNLKVLNENGFDYIDQVTKRRKYRFLLEPFNTISNSEKSEIPYRVIILFDADKPLNLKLVYDKVECDENGDMFNIFLNYTETINSIPLYTSIPEESFVIDDNYRNDKIFSVKKIQDKYNEIALNKNTDSGYQVVVPKKALDDYRRFEGFNWRYIARTRKSLNYLSMDNSDELDSSINGLAKTINVGILYSSLLSDDDTTIGAYALNRLMNSPFNFVNYNFVNPISEQNILNGTLDIDKNYKEYWKLDIDDIDNDLSLFDVLVWVPSAAINDNQASRLSSFVQANGTLILDFSKMSTGTDALETQVASGTSIDMQLVIGGTLTGEISELSTTSVLTDYTKNGGWNLATTAFEKEYYGIFGSNKIEDDRAYKTYRYFDDTIVTSEENIFLKMGPDTESLKPVGVIIPYNSNTSSALVRGNIIATTFPLIDYCNSIYQLNNYDRVQDINSGLVDGSAENAVYSGVVEGPMKFLFNCITFAAYCRLQASSELRTNSSLYNFVSNWNSGWTLNQNVLLDEEREKYFLPVPDSDGFGFDILKQDKLFDRYLKDIETILPDYQRDRLSDLNSDNIEFFIEITNPDVFLSNCIRIDPNSLTEEYNIPSAYDIYQVQNPNIKILAQTLSDSPSLEVPSGYGAYVIHEKSLLAADKNPLQNRMNVLNSFKEYPYSFATSYSAYQGTDRPSSFSVNSTLTYDVVFKGTHAIKTIVYGAPTTETIKVTTNKLCKNFVSSVDSGTKVYDSSNPLNTFIYTGDINIHKDPRSWKTTAPLKSHEYVKYIQFTLNNAISSKLDVDGYYGPATTAAAKQFQTSNSLRYKDGSVDSETKSYLAWWWKNLKSSDSARYTSIITAIQNDANLSPIAKYIQAVIDAGTASEIGKKTYKKLTFSGFRGPSQATDILFFEISDSFLNLNSIIIEAGGDKSWQNFSVDIYGYSSTPITDIFKTTNKPGPGAVVDGKIVIPFNKIQASKAKYIWIQVTGGSLSNFGSDYGQAEGFAIKSIKARGIVNADKEVPGDPIEVPDTEDVWCLATVEAPIYNSEVSIDREWIKTFRRRTIPRIDSLITSLKIGCDSSGSFENGSPFQDGQPYIADVSAATLSLDPSSGTSTFSENGIEIDFNRVPSFLTLQSIVVDSVDERGTLRSTNVIDASLLNKTVTLQTSAVEFAGSTFIREIADINSGFFLRKASSQLDIYQRVPNTININDGILLLCNQDGSPYGLMGQLSQYIQSVQSDMDGEDFDARVGKISVTSKIGEIDGMIYGLYDLNSRQFIGKSISYSDLVRRGIDNIFIGMAAFDADGNIHDNNEFFGPKSDQTFFPVQVPKKVISPIYSVKLNNSTFIKVGQIDPFISKFEAWTLPISSGQFNKSVKISDSINWSTWHANYMGQTLDAYYDSENQGSVYWSKIHGRGYYDVLDESPIIVDNRTIQLRRVPILNIAYPTDRASLVGVIKHDLFIYTRASVDSPWEQVQENIIRDINSETGTILFNNLIVPSNPDLIKVSYVAKDNFSQLKQIGGNPIPLNPLLNKNSIDFDSPLYIYLMPKAIFKKVSGTISNSGEIIPSSASYALVTEYSNSNQINFTYDKTIFDSRSIYYEPFALPIAIIQVINNPYKDKPTLTDVRLRGGGVVNDKTILELEEEANEVLSYWDVYPPMGEAYTKGGYVIIRIPESVKDHFLDEKEIYQIISNNLTAGIAYELQDMDGNSWN
jgi:peptidoglycan hydrolase-like protein with peptidoglycan-binding domain